MKKFFSRVFRLDFLKHKLHVKLICLILAVLAWFYVMDNLNPEVTNTFTNMPVQILGVEQIENQNLIVGEIENADVDVSLTGPWKRIMSMSERDITLTAALTGSTKGTVAIPIEVRLSDSTVSVDLSEKIMRVELDAIETEPRPVKTQLTGTPPAGVEIGELVKKQSEVSVTGPSKLLKTIAYVDAVGDIGTNQTSFTSFMQLTPRNDKDEEVAGVDVVEAFLEVEVPFIITKKVPIDLTFTPSYGDKHKLVSQSISPETVIIRGEKSLVDKIESIPTREYVLASSTPVEIVLPLILPTDVTAEDDEVTASFEVQPIESRTFNIRVTQVEILNQMPNYKYDFQNPALTIQVEVRDSREVLNEVEASDLKLTIDMTNLSPGTWTTPIKLEGFPVGSTASANPGSLPIVISETTGEEDETGN